MAAATYPRPSGKFVHGSPRAGLGRFIRVIFIL
jgi:hypothetical protein